MHYYAEKLTKMSKSALSRCVKERFLDRSLYLDRHRELTGSVLGRDSSSVQVLWKFVLQFLCNPADKINQPVNQPTNQLFVVGTIQKRLCNN